MDLVIAFIREDFVAGIADHISRRKSNEEAPWGSRPGCRVRSLGPLLMNGVRLASPWTALLRIRS